MTIERCAERCAERCPIVSRLPEAARLRILGDHALEACGDIRPGQIGPICGLPSGPDKDAMGQEARLAARAQAINTL